MENRIEKKQKFNAKKLHPLTFKKTSPLELIMKQKGEFSLVTYQFPFAKTTT